MKKLLISNLVVAIIVLGIVAAYAFRPEQKSTAKYATVQVISYTGGFAFTYDLLVVVDGKSTLEATESGAVKRRDIVEYSSETIIQANKQLEKLEEQGYQLVSTDVTNYSISGTVIYRTYNLRKP